MIKNDKRQFEFKCTAWIAGKRKIARGKTYKCCFLIVSCCHLFNREYKGEYFFTTHSQISPSHFKYPPLKLKLLHSKTAWLVPDRQEAIDPMTQGSVNVSDLSLFVSFGQFTKRQMEQLEPLTISDTFYEQSECCSVGFSKMLNGLNKHCKYDFFQFAPYLTEFSSSIKRKFKPWKLCPSGKYIYFCEKAAKEGDLILGEFSANSGMSGSPFLQKNPMTNQWQVVGIYTQACDGEMTTIVQRLLDYQQFGAPFNRDFAIDLKPFYMLNYQNKFPRSNSRLTIKAAQSRQRLIWIMNRIILKEEQEEIQLEADSLQVTLYNDLIGIESAVEGWEIFNHNIAIAGGRKFREIQKLINRFNDAPTDQVFDDQSAFVTLLKKNIQYPYTSQEEKNQPFKYRGDKKQISRLIFEGKFKKLSQVLEKAIIVGPSYNSLDEVEEKDEEEYLPPKPLKRVAKLTIKTRSSLKKASKNRRMQKLK